jgi:hypothetical protein
MDGVLGMYSWGDGMRSVRIWAMQDYESQVWSLKCSIDLPMMPEMALVEERRWQVRVMMIIASQFLSSS